MKIVRKSVVQELENVFDIEVEKNHNFFTTCGLVHNCHHASAVSFSQAMPRFNPRFRLSLSATPSRKDCTERVFFNTTGDVIYKGHLDKIDVGIRKIAAPFKMSVKGDYKPSDERKITILCKNGERNRLIVNEIFLACEKSRKCLILSDRLDHLDILSVKLGELLNERKMARSIDFYVGGRKEEELRVAAKASVIFATFSMAAEGLDIHDLDTLYLASPKGDVVQSVGRILRVCDTKKRPIVVEFIDANDELCMRRWKSREKYYIEQGWIK